MAKNGGDDHDEHARGDRLKTVQAVVDRMLRVGQAAQRLGISRRQLERLVLRYKAEGAAGLVSRKRGRPSNHQLAPGAAERALSDRSAIATPTSAPRLPARSCASAMAWSLARRPCGR